jgi:DnaJ-class molecular chaperone
VRKKRKSSRRHRPIGEVATVECAFCGGAGRDPYGILSPLSKCPVCNGRTKVTLTRPVYACAFCHGTGKQRHTRLTCSVCKGIGHVTITGPTTECPECDGKGRMRGADAPCAFCRGAGLVAGKPTMAAQVTSAATQDWTGGETQQSQRGAEAGSLRPLHPTRA